ncbi:hypothetical protein [Ructibacterium gallinarum]|nr:hypothetical protein [Ructibacterium gallinarum]
MTTIFSVLVFVSETTLAIPVHGTIMRTCIHSDSSIINSTML